MRELINKLNQATVAYDKGQPIMTDLEWDNLYYQLQNLEQQTGIIYPDSPTQTIFYQNISVLPKVTHNHPMLSLDKTKNLEDIDLFIGKNDYLAMAKLDGLTCSLYYNHGELISAETRGNGLIGEDITHNAKVITSIPQKIPFQEKLIIDGEIICTEENFKNFSNEYKNPRNFAAGSIRLLDARECANRKLTFIAWEVIQGFTQNLFTERLDALSNLGFLVVPWVQENLTHSITDLTNYCQHHGYPIDGIVFKFNNIEYGQSLGATSHHKKDAMAYKFSDEEYETVLQNIEWSMGKTGVLTPIAVYEDVDIDGSICNRANLHNINIMNDLLGIPFAGQPILVYRSNMVIPQVSNNTNKNNISNLNNIFKIPEICPVCGQPTKIITSTTGTQELYCTNPACEGKLINQLDHFFGKKGLDTKGLSIATFEKLIDWGWVTEIIDVFSLTYYGYEWQKKPGFGEKSVKKILDSIEQSRSHCPLNKFICAIGIPLIGNSTSVQLANYFQSWENFRQAITNNFDFSILDDIGEITSKEILTFDYTQADRIAKILNIQNVVLEKSSNKLQNKKIVITGALINFKNRAELQTAIEQAGGKVVSSISKNTDILINNNIESTSSKNIAAKKLNIPILTEDEFMKEYLID